MKILSFAFFLLIANSFFAQVTSQSTLIEKNENGQKVIYYETGKVKSIYDSNKKYEKEFYPDGQLKMEKNWSKKRKTKLKEYFPNGDLKKKQNHKNLAIYNQDKVLIEKIKRKEILIFERLFSKKKNRQQKFYLYKWESFDDRGIIKRKIIFDSDYFSSGYFPDSIQQINDFLFEEIIFYFNGKKFKKITLELDMKTKFSRTLVLYGREGEKWVQERTTSIDKIHSMIENYSN